MLNHMRKKPLEYYIYICKYKVFILNSPSSCKKQNKKLCD